MGEGGGGGIRAQPARVCGVYVCVCVCEPPPPPVARVAPPHPHLHMLLGERLQLLGHLANLCLQRGAHISVPLVLTLLCLGGGQGIELVLTLSGYRGSPNPQLLCYCATALLRFCPCLPRHPLAMRHQVHKHPPSQPAQHVHPPPHPPPHRQGCVQALNFCLQTVVAGLGGQGGQRQGGEGNAGGGFRGEQRGLGFRAGQGRAGGEFRGEQGGLWSRSGQGGQEGGR